MSRPPFIISSQDVPEKADKYPASDEVLAHGRAIGQAAGLLRIGLHLERLEPGHRLSYPHAEELEEEFVYVLEGQVDAWIDGELHPMHAGDLAAFPSGTGICHTFINNGDAAARLLVGGERTNPSNRIFYPLNPERRGQMPWSHWWDDIPARALPVTTPFGSHHRRRSRRRVHGPRARRARSNSKSASRPVAATARLGNKTASSGALLSTSCVATRRRRAAACGPRPSVGEAHAAGTTSPIVVVTMPW